jgi:hypothetical protein
MEPQGVFLFAFTRTFTAFSSLLWLFLPVQGAGLLGEEDCGDPTRSSNLISDSKMREASDTHQLLRLPYFFSLVRYLVALSIGLSAIKKFHPKLTNTQRAMEIRKLRSHSEVYQHTDR